MRSDRRVRKSQDPVAGETVPRRHAARSCRRRRPGPRGSSLPQSFAGKPSCASCGGFDAQAPRFPRRRSIGFGSQARRSFRAVFCAEHPNTRADRPRAGRVTVQVDGSPQAAAPSIQMVPARDRLIGPNRGSWSRGRHSLTNRTGSGSARVVERAEEPRRSAWSIPERRRAVLTAGRRDNVTTRKGRRAGAGCCLKRNARAGSCAMPGVMRRRSGLDRRGVHGSGPNDWFRQHPKPPCVLQVRHGSS